MKEKIHKHHFLSAKTAFIIAGCLLFLTFVTVSIARIDLGSFNFIIAMVVATIKASLVGLFFMNLLYDRKENRVIFLSSFVFLTIFMALTSVDLFSRGDVYVHGPLNAESQTKSKGGKPWISTPERIAHGKEVYQLQCVACHGLDGKGNGPAASALNPAPRNFESPSGWKNGRKPTLVFKTLKEGIAGGAMASYASLPADDRWALAHYVLSVGPPPGEDTPEDFIKIGVDPSVDIVPEKQAVRLPIDFTIEQIVKEQEDVEQAESPVFYPIYSDRVKQTSVGGRLYQAHCASCHGDHTGGGLIVKTLSGYPSALLTTKKLKKSTQEEFSKIVIGGIPGESMPAHAELTDRELKELYLYINDNLQ